MGQRYKGIHSKDNLNENSYSKRFEFYLENEMTREVCPITTIHSLSFNYLKMHE